MAQDGVISHHDAATEVRIWNLAIMGLIIHGDDLNPYPKITGKQLMSLLSQKVTGHS